MIFKTIEDYENKLFNPNQYLFVNKFQTNKLSKELEKILQKACDFDEEILKYNINDLNKNNENV
mgnify:FL=1